MTFSKGDSSYKIQELWLFAKMTYIGEIKVFYSVKVLENLVNF